MVEIEKSKESAKKHLKTMTEEIPEHSGMGPKSQTWMDPIVGARVLDQELPRELEGESLLPGDSVVI